MSLHIHTFTLEAGVIVIPVILSCIHFLKSLNKLTIIKIVLFSLLTDVCTKQISVLFFAENSYGGQNIMKNCTFKRKLPIPKELKEQYPIVSLTYGYITKKKRIETKLSNNIT